MSRGKNLGKLKNKKSIFKGIKDQSLFGSSIIFESHPQLFQILEKQNPTQYDKIMDQFYRETHIGGGAHRHFDGSHTFKGSYDKIKEATGSVDLVEYFKSHFNEFVTPEGIPFFNLNKNHHELISNQMSESLGGTISPGQIREYIRDFNSFNSGEFASASVGAIFLFFAVRSKNPKAISRVTAVNICLGIATANPFQVVLGVAGLGYGLYHGKIKSYELLRGSAPAISGIIGYQTANKIFNFSKNGSIIFSIGTAIGTEMLLSHLEKRKKEQVLKELGKENPHYIPVLTPNILNNELIKLSRRSQKLSLGSAI